MAQTDKQKKKKRVAGMAQKSTAESMAKQEQKKRGRFSTFAQKSSVWRKSVWLRVWWAGANKKTRDKALNQKHKIINLKFSWVFYFYSLNFNFQKSF